VGLSLLTDAGVTTIDVATLGGGGYGFVAALAVDPANNWWVGHSFFGEGITLNRGNPWWHLDSRQGLYSDRIRAIAADDRRSVWLIDDAGRVAVYLRTDLIERMSP
jgi:hypothetical protein